jgi:threonine synthase
LNYKSTRSSDVNVSSAQAIAQGICGDGGLFVPENLPRFSYSDLCELQHLSYTQRAAHILSLFLSDFTADEIEDCVTQAYTGGKFDQDMPAPMSLLQNGRINMYLLELWHGPTCAFKDMALQLLPHLLTKSLKKINSSKTAVILVATSGDTGKAALEGFKDVEGTQILVFYPQNGVSPMQKRQMNTQEGTNVSVCAIEGNFDDAQTGVKKLFTDARLNDLLAQNGMMFSSANSINWGRLLPQIVYYFSAYCDLMVSGEIDREGEEVNIVVPTGNFGNILAAYYAKKMGLSVHKFICASNSNNVLTEFLNTGVYDRNRDFYATISPSMDILVSSNLERLLYDLTDGDSAKAGGWMKELAATGKYQVDDKVLSKLQAIFYAGCCDDSATKETIKEIHDTENYLCDTHTAVALNVYHQYINNTNDIDTPAIVVSTASPYKFADSVLSAVSSDYSKKSSEFEKIKELSALTGTPIPAPIELLESKPVRFENVCAKASMGEVVLNMAGIK